MQATKKLTSQQVTKIFKMKSTGKGKKAVKHEILPYVQLRPCETTSLINKAIQIIMDAGA